MLAELVQGWTAEAPGRPLLLSDGETLSYDECLSRAEGVAAELTAQDVARFGIANAGPEATLIALVAASQVGCEPCVYPPDLDSAGIERLAERLGHETVLTSLEQLGRSATGASPPATDKQSPVMILTTGTTGEPKAVRHDWRRLAEAVRHPDDSRDARWLLAYNLNQFAGMQVLLHVLVSGSTLVAPASARAQDVLETLRRADITHLSATPTFWRLLLGAITSEESGSLGLRQITLGGEPTPESLLARLRKLFPKAKVTHVYAGTEFGSVVSVNDGRAGLPLSVLDRGEDSPASFRIVDEELQVRSRVGMLGYLGDPATEEHWQPTGDLVEISDDRIRFVGRTTEIINVGGAKVHPLPIEELACSVDGVELAAAYGHPNPVTGEIVALDLVAAPEHDPQDLEQAVYAVCQSLPRPGRPRRIRFVESLEVRGNKLIRGGR